MDTQLGALVRVVVTASGHGGTRWAIVELGDGRLGIAQDGQVLQTVRFHTCDMEACVREFVRRTGMEDRGDSRASRPSRAPR